MCTNSNNELFEYCKRIRKELEAVYNGEAKTEDGETASMYDYFEDALDIEYTINSRGEYLGARVYVTLGGPNVWVDTRRGEIAGAWGTDRADIWLPSEIAEEIDGVFSECFEAVRA